MRGCPKHFNTKADLEMCLDDPVTAEAARLQLYGMPTERYLSLGYESRLQQYEQQDQCGGPYQNWNVVWLGDSYTTLTFYNVVLSMMGFDLITNSFTHVDTNAIFAETGWAFWAQLADHQAEFTDMHFDSDYHKNVIVLRHAFVAPSHSGDPETSEEMLGILHDWYVARHAAGWIVVSSTSQPSSYGLTGQDDYPAVESRRNVVDAEMIAHPELYTDVLADISAEPHLGIRHCETDTEYFLDRLHCTDLGNALAASYVRNAIVAWLAAQ